MAAEAATVKPVSFRLASGKVYGGYGTTGIVKLNRPAPKKGLVIKIKSGGRGVKTPGSVKVKAGATVATFAVRTTKVARKTPVGLRVSSGKTVKKRTLNVLPLPTLASLDLSATEVVGGGWATGEVTLTGPAKPGGTVVSLRAVGPGGVPSKVRVPEGTESASFSITTEKVSNTRWLEVFAKNGKVRQRSLKVRPVPDEDDGVRRVTGLYLDPWVVDQGGSTTLKVTLDRPAPKGGTRVELDGPYGSPPDFPRRLWVEQGSASAEAKIKISGGAPVGTFALRARAGSTLWVKAELCVQRALKISSLEAAHTTVFSGEGGVVYVTLNMPNSTGAPLDIVFTLEPGGGVVGRAKVEPGLTGAYGGVTFPRVPERTAYRLRANGPKDQVGGEAVLNGEILPGLARASFVAADGSPLTGITAVGQQVKAIVELDAPARAATVVQVAVSTLNENETKLAHPSTVTIPAGQQRAEVPMSVEVLRGSGQIHVLFVLEGPNGTRDIAESPYVPFKAP